MKRFHLVLGIVVLACACPIHALSQTTSPGGTAPSQKAERPHANRIAVEKEVLGKLNLTPSQQERVKPLLANLETQGKALRKEAKGTTDKAALKEKRKALHQEYLKSLSAILTPAQVKQYKALHKELAAKSAHPKAGTPPPR